MSDDPLLSNLHEVVASTIVDHFLPGSGELVAEIVAALDRTYDAALAPALDLISRWETDGTADRKMAAARIRGVIEDGHA